MFLLKYKAQVVAVIQKPPISILTKFWVGILNVYYIKFMAFSGFIFIIQKEKLLFISNSKHFYYILYQNELK